MRRIRPSPPQRKFHVAIIGAALLTSSVACAEFKSTAPADVNLAGTWKLNHELSDAPPKVLKERRAGTSEGEGGTLSTSGGVGFPDAGGPSTQVAGRAAGGDREGKRGQMMHRLEIAEQIDIEQRNDAMTLTSDASTASCDTTETTQVSTPDGGVADRRCGWDGNAFVIELKSPHGFTQRDSYTLSDDGKQLIMTTELKGGPMQAPTIKRVYDRAEAR
jgi:hypothetical protein